MTIKIAINGASGRMGKALTRAGSEDKNVQLGAAFDIASSSSIGCDVGVVAGISDTGIVIAGELASHHADFEVLIDFSVPECTMQSLKVCRAYGKAMVIGTTGLDDNQKQELREAGKEIAIVFSPNMSVGVNLCLGLLQTAAKMLGDDYDVEIIEAHHRHKIDAPSGTALRMGEVIANSLGRNINESAIYGRQGHTGERDRKAIGFETIRAGDIVGEHTVMFCGMGERIEIAHKATSRMTFARGAIRAAIWVAAQERGLYDMQDVLAA